MIAARHIVYITSEHSLSQTRRMVMEEAGYTVATADTVEGALSALHRCPAFLVVIGVLTLPKVARQAIEAVRREPGAPAVLSLVPLPEGEADYSLAAMAGPEELLSVIGEALIRSHGHTAPVDDCYLFVDGDRRYIHVTDAAAELLGFRRGELIGKAIEDIAAPEIDVEEQFDRYVQDGSQSGTVRLRRNNGDLISVAYHAEVLADGCMVSHLFPSKSLPKGTPQELLVRKIRPI